MLLHGPVSESRFQCDRHILFSLSVENLSLDGYFQEILQFGHTSTSALAPSRLLMATIQQTTAMHQHAEDSETKGLRKILHVS